MYMHHSPYTVFCQNIRLSSAIRPRQADDEFRARCAGLLQNDISLKDPRGLSDDGESQARSGNASLIPPNKRLEKRLFDLNGKPWAFIFDGNRDVGTRFGLPTDFKSSPGMRVQDRVFDQVAKQIRQDHVVPKDLERRRRRYLKMDLSLLCLSSEYFSCSAIKPCRSTASINGAD